MVIPSTTFSLLVWVYQFMYWLVRSVSSVKSLRFVIYLRSLRSCLLAWPPRLWLLLVACLCLAWSPRLWFFFGSIRLRARVRAICRSRGSSTSCGHTVNRAVGLACNVVLWWRKFCVIPYIMLWLLWPPLSWSLQGLHCSTSILSGSVLDLHVYEAIVPVIGPFSTHVLCTAWSKPLASSWLSPTRLPIYRRSPFLFCSEQIYLFLSLPPSTLEYVKETALYGVGGHVALTVGRWWGTVVTVMVVTAVDQFGFKWLFVSGHVYDPTTITVVGSPPN